MFSSVFSLKTTDLGAFLSETVQNMACTLVCYERKTEKTRRKLINEIKKKSCKTTQPRHKVYAKTANFRTPELSSNSSRLGFGETPEQ